LAASVAKNSVYVHTADQLWDKIMPFTHGTDPVCPSIGFNPWPFVALVRCVGSSQLEIG
jgi:hypothetical protein